VLKLSTLDRVQICRAVLQGCQRCEPPAGRKTRSRRRRARSGASASLPHCAPIRVQGPRPGSRPRGATWRRRWTCSWPSGACAPTPARAPPSPRRAPRPRWRPPRRRAPGARRSRGWRRAWGSCALRRPVRARARAAAAPGPRRTPAAGWRRSLTWRARRCSRWRRALRKRPRACSGCDCYR